MFITDRTRPIIETIADIESFGSNDIDETDPTMTYIGKEDRNGRWVLQSIDTSVANVKTIRYATDTNNPSATSYSNAWSNRTSLNYDIFSEVI